MATQLDRIEKRLDRIEAAIKGTTVTPQPAGPDPSDPANPHNLAQGDWLAFVQKMIPPQSTRTPEQEKRMVDAITRAYDQEAHFKGKFGVETLQPIDQAYLDSVRDSYFLKTGEDIRFDGVIGGKAKDINQTMNNGMALKNQFDLANYKSPLKTEVERRMA